MKNLPLLFLAVLLSAGSLMGQSFFGVKVGATIADVEQTQDGVEVETNSEVDLQFGALLDIGISKAFSIQPEVTYMKRKNGFKDPIIGLKGERSISYLDLGALAKLRFGTENVIGGYIGAGPFFNYILNGKVAIGETETDLDFGDDKSARTDLSLVGALGLTFRLGGPTIFADARYIHGLGDLDNAKVSEVKNRTIGLSAGLMFPL